MKTPIYKTKKRVVAVCGFENEDIQEAIKVSSTDMSEEERLVVRELMMKTANLKKEVRDLEHKSPGIKQRT